MTALIGKMKDVLKATRSGRLVDATTMIREALGRGIPEPDGQGDRPSRRRLPHHRRRSDGGMSDIRRATPSPAPIATRTSSTFARHEVHSESGSRRYKLFVPASDDVAPMPLIVMLHGCTQSPDDFAIGTRMNELAQEMGFLVAYPEQTSSANASRCWNWFRPSDQAHGKGEPAIIADMTMRIMRHHRVAPDRVFVAGLSAGGAAAAIMGQAYPTIFAAVGVHSGLACGAAHDMMSAFAAMRGGGTASLPASGHAMRTIVFQGSADRTVHPANAAQVLRQAGACTISLESDGRSADGTPFTRRVYEDGDGRALAEEWMIEGAGHAWSGGNKAGSYTSSSGPDASREMLRFFGID